MRKKIDIYEYFYSILIESSDARQKEVDVLLATHGAHRDFPEEYLSFDEACELVDIGNLRDLRERGKRKKVDYRRFTKPVSFAARRLVTPETKYAVDNNLHRLTDRIYRHFLAKFFNINYCDASFEKLKIKDLQSLVNSIKVSRGYQLSRVNNFMMKSDIDFGFEVLDGGLKYEDIESESDDDKKIGSQEKNRYINYIRFYFWIKLQERAIFKDFNKESRMYLAEALKSRMPNERAELYKKATECVAKVFRKTNLTSSLILEDVEVALKPILIDLILRKNIDLNTNTGQNRFINALSFLFNENENRIIQTSLKYSDGSKVYKHDESRGGVNTKINRTTSTKIYPKLAFIGNCIPEFFRPDSGVIVEHKLIFDKLFHTKTPLTRTEPNTKKIRFQKAIRRGRVTDINQEED